MKNKYHTNQDRVNYFLIEDFKNINQDNEFFKCLEIGCNQGYNLNAIQELYPKAEYYGIDINDEAINFGKNKYPNINFIQNDIEKLNFSQNNFDYILLPDILEHLTQPEKILKYLINNILKETGKIFICIPNLLHYSVIYNLLCKGLFTYTETGLLDYDHKHLFTLNELYKIFNNLNLKAINGYGIDINPELTKEKENFIKTLCFFREAKEEYKTFSYHFILEKDNIND